MPMWCHVVQQTLYSTNSYKASMWNLGKYLERWQLTVCTFLLIWNLCSTAWKRKEEIFIFSLH